MKRLRKFFSLPAADQKLLVKAAVLLWVVRIGLWVLPFRTVCRLLTNVKERAVSSVINDDHLEKIVASVKRSSRLVPAATCLPQALVTVALMESAQLDATMRIGVAKNPAGKLEAHAWVESDGKVIIGGADSDLSRFTVLQPVQEI
jgi:transglutaminase superfamily protein